MVAALCLAAAGSFAPVALELEAGLGATWSLDTEYGGGEYPVAPVVQARFALDLQDHFAVGLSFLSVLGGGGDATIGSSPGGADASAFSAWSALASIRLHTAGKIQVWVEAGGGLGRLIRLQESSSFEHPPYSSATSPSWRIATGGRFRATDLFWVGAELAYVRWTGVSVPAGAGCCNAPAQSGLSSNALLLLFSGATTWLP